jgi:predicted dehydrogenase/acetyltransferase-like isoleucine patch superfamily enzyme
VSLKVAVVGVGYWGKNLVRNFAQLNALIGVCDQQSAVAENIAKIYHCRVLSWSAILQDEQIDAVAISTPAASHAVLVEQALAANKHVFVEKPIALAVSEAEKLCELAQRQSRCLMVGHLLQYHPAFIKLKMMVDAGRLGRVQYLYSNRLNFGKIRREEDILWSFAPHDISMILSLVGSEPISVDTQGSYFLHKNIADVTTTHLTFPAGEQAHIFVSWLHPCKEQKLVIVGDKAMAVFDDTQPWPLKLKLYQQHIEWREGMPMPIAVNVENIVVNEVEPLAQECQHFLDCITQQLQPRTDGWEGVKVLKVLAQAAQSLQRRSNQLQLSSSVRYPHVQIHQTACIDEDVQIGMDTKIWHFSHILARTSIGEHCVIGQNVAIGPDVKIGDRCKIQNNVSLYKGVILADDVFCGPSCVFTNVNTPRAHIERKNEFCFTQVGRGVTIGANATIICGVKLGDYAFIGAGAVVTKDVPPHALVVGNPAKQIGWVSHAGERLPENLICPRENKCYAVNEDNELIEVGNV